MMALWTTFSLWLLGEYMVCRPMVMWNVTGDWSSPLCFTSVWGFISLVLSATALFKAVMGDFMSFSVDKILRIFFDLRPQMNWSLIRIVWNFRKLHLDATSESRIMNSGIDSFWACLRALNFIASETLGNEMGSKHGDDLAEHEDMDSGFVRTILKLYRLGKLISRLL